MARLDSPCCKDTKATRLYVRASRKDGGGFKPYGLLCDCGLTTKE